MFKRNIVDFNSLFTSILVTEPKLLYDLSKATKWEMDLCHVQGKGANLFIFKGCENKLFPLEFEPDPPIWF